MKCVMCICVYMSSEFVDFFFCSDSNDRMSAIVAQMPDTPLADPSTNAAIPFDIQVLPARDDNTYICNETHFRALQALAQSEAIRKQDISASKLIGAFFVHVPYASATAPDGSYSEIGLNNLAQAVAVVVLRLVQHAVKSVGL
eukprot:c1770_g1_i2.p1 GENE.c1770_g1_i2~~c1770_g1_i2.p1  ORF type:complete len:143 (+),score=32.34 c1770_g1_i2:68-496(+)